MTGLGIVLVSGGASGLGAAVCRAVDGSGGTGVALDRVECDGAHVVADVADRKSVQNAVDEVVERYGSIDAVVTAAGIDRCGTLEEVDADAWDRVVAVNLLGTVNLVRAALPRLPDGGRVVTVASTLGLRALPAATAYCASKFGVVGFTRALALEVDGRVGVTLLVPGGMRTSFFDDRDAQYQPGPDARLSSPDDVAGAVLAALAMPRGVELRELVVTPSVEPSWP